MSLPKFLEPFLPSYDISKMDLDDPFDKREIITQVLNYGDKQDILWLFKKYNLREIRKVLSSPMRGYWRERSLNYWLKIFNIKLPKMVYETAIMSLRPRPKLMEKFFSQALKNNKKQNR